MQQSTIEEHLFAHEEVSGTRLSTNYSNLFDKNVANLVIDLQYLLYTDYLMLSLNPNLQHSFKIRAIAMLNLVACNAL